MCNNFMRQQRERMKSKEEAMANDGEKTVCERERYSY